MIFAFCFEIRVKPIQNDIFLVFSILVIIYHFNEITNHWVV